MKCGEVNPYHPNPRTREFCSPRIFFGRGGHLLKTHCGMIAESRTGRIGHTTGAAILLRTILKLCNSNPSLVRCVQLILYLGHKLVLRVASSQTVCSRLASILQSVQTKESYSSKVDCQVFMLPSWAVRSCVRLQAPASAACKCLLGGGTSVGPQTSRRLPPDTPGRMVCS